MLQIDKKSTFVACNPIRTTRTTPSGPPQDLSLTDPTWSYGHGAAYRAMFLEILGDWAKKVDVSSSIRLLQYHRYVLTPASRKARLQNAYPSKHTIFGNLFMAIPANLIRIQRIPVGAPFDTEREFTWRFRRLLAFVAPDLVGELERALLRFPLRGATHKLSKDNVRFKRAVKEAQHETDKERLWSSEEVYCQHARSNIIYRWFERDLKQHFLNTHTWEENLEVIQKVWIETNKVGLSGNLPGGFYRRISILLSPMAVECVQSLAEIIPAPLLLAPCSE
ncbi:hypothetical protein MMC31_002238 [Peltigera leucophlebia]|nr:hypothetical protein [Peltigera leucophlebia]